MRHYGILSNRAKAKALNAARKALKQPPLPPPVLLTKGQRKAQFLEKMLGRPLDTCPHCGSVGAIEQRPLNQLPHSRAPPHYSQGHSK